jgi:hypothetical protein
MLRPYFCIEKVIFFTGYILNLLKKDPFSKHVYVVVQNGIKSFFSPFHNSAY